MAHGHYEAGHTTLDRNDARTQRQEAAKTADGHRRAAAGAAGPERRSIGAVRTPYGSTGGQR